MVSTAHAVGRQQPVAVIGMGCAFPGARGPEQLWELLRDGVDALGEQRKERFSTDTLNDSDADGRGTAARDRGGFLDRVDEFDADFFEIGPDEAARIDPQQRILLMTAWEALEDAGQPLEGLAGSRTAVFVGQMHADYWEAQLRQGTDTLDLDAFTGSHQRSLASGRLSYAFDLRGPSVTVDTAQASSLVAVHLACQSLRGGESALALAGGVNLILGPHQELMLSRAGVLAPDGRCKFGDEDADGFVRSEGAGVVVLKLLDRALADGDRIRAVLLGSAVGNDGRSKPGLTAPSVTGQRTAMRWAYESAGVLPGEVDYVEAHGTGTGIDAVELAALGEVLSEGRPSGRPCLVGSVKTNIGHTEAAAGIAGLIKTVLCLEHSQVPPSLHHRRPSTRVDWNGLPLVVPVRLQPLPERGRPTVAGVNGQSISGANVHLVLRQSDPDPIAYRPPAGPGRPQLLTFTARSPQGLDELAVAYQAYLAPHGAGRAFELPDICHSAAARRTHHGSRLAVMGESHDALARSLQDYLSGRADDAKVAVAHDIPAGERHLVAPVLSVRPSAWAGLLHSVTPDGLPAGVSWTQLCEPTGRYVPVPLSPWQPGSFWLTAGPAARSCPGSV
ncbi:polyketide synthase [Kitasatospora sp. MAP5-34]|uniref:type I polyketide synthase n=1 Tax=Kitasatospora sp. MAP5-34 TaxID=3035102 RepID=UPI00247494DE|nr:polyketide synthase [Kitasatospora sp. MAP5-34]MDH6579331.1 3-oxoacyl-[acyl-carrier-protein] synthase II [Kitasatospora sp. MAP5-34]